MLNRRSLTDAAAAGQSPGSRSKGGRPSRDEAERLHKKILDAAERQFLSKGFGDTRIESIAAAAGTSKKTIYARFANKEGLFIAVDERILSKPVKRALTRVEGSFEERLTAASLDMLASVLEPKIVRIYSIIAGEAARFPDLARRGEYASAFPARQALRRLLTEGLETGEIICDDAQRAIELLETIVNMAPLNWAVLGIRKMDAAQQEDWVRSAVSLFLKGYGRRP